MSFCLVCMLKKHEKTKTKTKIVKVGDVKIAPKKKRIYANAGQWQSAVFSSAK